MSDDVKARAREALAQYRSSCHQGFFGPYPELVADLLAALEAAETERDDYGARIIEAADALSPGIGAMVGGRGLAIAAKQIIAERDAAHKVIRASADYIAARESLEEYDRTSLLNSLDAASRALSGQQ